MKQMRCPQRLSPSGGLVTLSILASAALACTEQSPNALIQARQDQLVMGAAGTTGAGGGTTGGGSAGSGSAGSGGFPTDGGMGVPDGGFGGFAGPVGHWMFDDCKAKNALLSDSSGSAANATKSATVACVTGADGSGVSFSTKKDTVTVPSNPVFDVTDHIAVAAWIKPKTIAQGTVVAKQASGHTPFALTVTKSNIAFSVEVGKKTFVSKAPIKANVWTHVAGTYDGQFVFLFVNGQQVGQVAAAGVVHDVPAAGLSFGNDTGGVFLNGIVDEVWISKDPVTVSDIDLLACIHHPAKVVVSPISSGPVNPDTTVSYDIALTNTDFGACQPSFEFIQPDPAPDGFTATVANSFLVLDQGATAHVDMDVTGTTDADPGTYQLTFQLFDGQSPAPISGHVEYIMNAPAGCFVRSNRELMIRDLSVVEDPIRTVWDTASSDPRSGAFSFGRLMQQMAPKAATAPAFTEKLFKTWLTDQKVNGFTVPARPAMQQLVLDSWPRLTSGALDLTKAPLRLLAIVARLDLRDLSKGQAGEARFVFGVLDPSGFQTQFTMILEYRLPAKTTADVQAWAQSFHALQSLPVPSETYNAALQKITDKFTARGAEPGRANGSALGQLRTNEIALSSRWELREFQLSDTTGNLVEATVKLTPDTGFITDSPVLADFVNQNAAAILTETHTVPNVFEGKPFLGGSSFNDLNAWTSTGIKDNEARHHFSLNTCNGCHSASETGTFFLQISPRDPGTVAQLSGFLTGTTVSDPVTGAPRAFNDLKRRNQDLAQIVCPVATASAASAQPAAQSATTSATTATSARDAFLSKGISRVH